MTDRGFSIGPYEILGELGRGGMGIVYRARDSRDRRVVALKIVPPESLERPDSALRFKREFRAMRRVQHPNVIRVFEAGTHDKCPYFTMEFVDGKDIHVWLDGPEPIVPGRHRPPPVGPLSEEQRQRLNDPTRLRRLSEAVVQVGLALTAIHAHRIVHRDLKPDNILVSHAGVVKLMDFGIAKTLAQSSEHSSSGMVLGTFKYLSPEQALGSDVDGRADLYCLGVILYELLAGRHPFYSENSVGYAFHHARNAPPPLRRFNPEVHRGLADICERLLAKDPSERYPTAEDVVDAIRGAVDGMVQVEAPSSTDTAATPGPTSQASLFSPAMIARDAERRKLLALGEQVRKGRGSTALICGGRRMGKSRLVRDVAAKCRANGVDVFIGEALEGGRGDNQPFLQIFEAMLRGAAQVHGADEVKRLMGRDGAVLARYLPALPSILQKPMKAAAPLDPKGERARFLGAASGLLERAAMRRPTVLVVDGLERADELTLDLARHLIELCNAIGPTQESGAFRLCPIGLFLTVDPSVDDDETTRRLLAEYEDASAVQTLTLAPLNVMEVGELMQSMIGGGNIGSAVSEALHERTLGVPGLVEEQIRAWAQAGDLVRQRREWVLLKDAAHKRPQPRRSKGREAVTPPSTTAIGLSNATRADIPIPDLEEQVGDARLDQLPRKALALLEQAAVLGERVDQRILLRCALLHEDEFLDAIDDVLRAGLLLADDERGAFRFPQSSLRSTLLKRLPSERRAQLHRLAGRVLEAESERGASSQYAAILARHFLEADDRTKALQYLLRAAREALEISAIQSASNLATEAQRLFLEESAASRVEPTAARRDAELVMLRLDILAATGEHREVVAVASRRVPRLRGAVDGRLVGEVLLRLASSERSLGELDLALEHLTEVLQITDRGGAHPLRCRAKRLCGVVYQQKGQFERSGEYFRDALQLARTIGDEGEEEQARRSLATRQLDIGELEMAQSEFEALLERARARGEPARVAQYLNLLGTLRLERGKLAEAERDFREAIDHAKPAGDRQMVAMGLFHIAMIRREQRRRDDALALCAKAARVARAISDVEGLSHIHIIQAQTALDANDAESARDAATKAVELANRAGAAVRRTEAQMCLAVLDVKAGRCDEAIAELERGLNFARALQANRLVLFGLRGVALAYLHQGNKEAAQRAVDEAIGRVQRTAFLRFLPPFEELADRISRA